MKTRELISVTVPVELAAWIAKQAGARRMSKSEVTSRLLARGIQAESIEETVARIAAAANSSTLREVLRQTFVLRYIVEGLAKGSIRMPETLGTDALNWADSELLKSLHSGGQNEHQPQ